MPDACPRCFWIKNTQKKLPYQVFPGIFASIDGHVKSVVHSVFDTTGFPPLWIPEFKDAVKYLPVPHWSKTKRTCPDTGLVVTGVPDDLLECADGSLIIPDYKTARHSEGQDKLLPIYIGQLNAYRWIWQGLGYTVKSLPLIYCEPLTDLLKPNLEGFALHFSPKAVMVEIDEELVPRLLARASAILSGKMPEKSADCSDCECADKLAATVKP
jgi:hypothetical protein